MGPHVDHEAASKAEISAAGFTGIRFLVRVRPHVAQHVILLSEGFLADFTGIRFLSSVNSGMRT